MTVSILLRLLPDELRAGRLVGRLRIVSTGEERRFKDAAELMEVACAALDTADPERHVLDELPPPGVDRDP
jgi:hypothetical protein